LTYEKAESGAARVGALCRRDRRGLHAATRAGATRAGTTRTGSTRTGTTRTDDDHHVRRAGPAGQQR